MSYEDIEVFNEKASPSVKKKAESKGYTVIDTYDKDTSGYVSFASLNKLNTREFETEFLKLCHKMEDVYDAKIIYIPLDGYVNKYGKDAINAITVTDGSILGNICYMLNMKASSINKLDNFIIVFVCGNKWFAINTSEYKKTDYPAVVSNLKMLLTNDTTIRHVTGNNKTKTNNVKEVKSKKAIEREILEKEKEELVKNIAMAADASVDEEEALEYLDDNIRVAEIIRDLDSSDYGKPKFTNARTNRINKLNDGFMTSKINGKSVKEMIEDASSNEELPTSNITVNSPNEEWKDIKFINFNKEYDIDEDIALILASFADKSRPIGVRKIEIEDTSTSLDYIYTYKVEMEDIEGKRFTITIDIPKIVSNRFLMLRGNQKVISGQLINLPCTKTADDTVQLVSNYSKIFIYRYGSLGKAHPSSDIFLKTIKKYDGKKIKIITGDFSRTCSKYDLPIDYMDLASNINYIETTDAIYHFDQDIYYTDYAVDNTKGIPIGIRKVDNAIIYYANLDPTLTTSSCIASELCLADEAFAEIYNKQKPATKHMYSKAKIMSGFIPLVVVICNRISFNDLLNRAKIKYRIEDKRVRIDSNREGIIKFANKYLVYELTYASSMLLNGLLDCNVEMYNIEDLNRKQVWIEMLDNFGGKILADGLENFAELFVDPITASVCEECGLPTDYIDLLLEGNKLLADTKFIDHTDITGNRYRTNEIIAGHLYKVLARSYGDYIANVRRGRKKAAMTIKRSALIDDIMSNPVTSDLSVMTPLLELEANYSATFKGLSGLNTDRAYGLDKRTFDDTMLNKLALSTGFSENVGINRQTTMDMDIKGKRGYIKESDPDDSSFIKRLSATEGVTPFGSTRDDPFRTAMTFIQTAKHSMPINQSAPLLVTNGTDEAMPYMVSDTFAFKAKDDGEIKELVPEQYMIVSYKDGTGEYISLKEEVKKNSDGGFFLTIQLSTTYKQGQKFKKDDILAYDAKSFSNKIGEADGLAYNIGVLSKVAILATDEGFEDSTSISQWLSQAMGTSVVTQIPVTLSSNINVYNIVKVGDPIEEGEPLLIMQDSITDKDAAILLSNITDGDYVSDLGRVKIKSKYTGIVQDIKIYRTCEIEELSPSLKKLVEEYEIAIKEKRKLYREYNIPGENTVDPDYALTQTGKLKNVYNGVLIEFHIKYIDTMSVGDKLVLQSANKGVVKYLFPEGQEPYTAFRPEEKIHALASSRSFNNRMVTSPIVSGYINKGLIELDRAVKKIMGITPKAIEDIQ